MSLTLCLAFSAHIALPGEWNEIHPCISYREDAFIAGAYLNSEGKVSAYAGVELRSDDLFMELGAVTGYSGADVLPFVRGGVEFENGNRLFVAPAYSDGEVGAVVGFEIPMTRGE
jgi:hypothetical protein